MALTKTDIVELIAEKNDFSPAEAKDVLEELIEIIKSTLASGEDLMISGFGKFQINEKNRERDEIQPPVIQWCWTRDGWLHLNVSGN